MEAMQCVSCVDREVDLEVDVLVAEAPRTWHHDALDRFPVARKKPPPRRLPGQDSVEQLLQRRQTQDKPEESQRSEPQIYAHKPPNAAGGAKGRSHLKQEHCIAAERGVQIPDGPRVVLVNSLSARQWHHDGQPSSRRRLYHTRRALPARRVHVRLEALKGLVLHDGFESLVHRSVPRYLCTHRDEV
jgi:hypothetical protein